MAFYFQLVLTLLLALESHCQSEITFLRPITPEPHGWCNLDPRGTLHCHPIEHDAVEKKIYQLPCSNEPESCGIDLLAYDKTRHVAFVSRPRGIDLLHVKTGLLTLFLPLNLTRARPCDLSLMNEDHLLITIRESTEREVLKDEKEGQVSKEMKESNDFKEEPQKEALALKIIQVRINWTTFKPNSEPENVAFFPPQTFVKVNAMRLSVRSTVSQNLIQYNVQTRTSTSSVQHGLITLNWKRKRFERSLLQTPNFILDVHPVTGGYVYWQHDSRQADGVMTLMELYVGRRNDITMNRKLIEMPGGLFFVENAMYRWTLHGSDLIMVVQERWRMSRVSSIVVLDLRHNQLETCIAWNDDVFSSTIPLQWFWVGRKDQG